MVLVDCGDYARTQNCESYRGWNRQHHHHGERTWERVPEFTEIAQGGTASDCRESRGRDRDTKHPQRELHEPIRVIQPAYRTVHDHPRRVTQVSGEIRVHQNIDLRRGAAQEGGPHEHEYVVQSFMSKIDRGPEGKAGLHQAGKLKGNL